MNKMKLHSLFLVGLGLFSANQVINYTVGFPAPLQEFLAGAGCGLMLTGILKMAFNKFAGQSRLGK